MNFYIIITYIKVKEVYNLNKLDFNKLNIQDQVQLLNDELKKNSTISVTKLCKQLGLVKSTVIDRFTKAGYKYNHEMRQYIKSIDVIQKNNKSITSEPTIDKMALKPIIQKDNKSIIHKQPNISGIESEEIKGLLELLEIKDQLKELIQNNNKSKNIIDVDLHELKIDTSKFDGELKGRLVKVYENINANWIKFCKSYNEFKMQDLYSLALLEFMDKYKKDIK